MNRLMPYLGVLVAIFAAGCVMETETEMEEPTADNAFDHVGTPAPDEPGYVEPCGRDLVLDPEGKPVEVPVLCDPNAERLPDLGEEEVTDPFTEVELPIQSY